MKVHTIHEPLRDRINVFVEVGTNHWLTHVDGEQHIVDAPPEAEPPKFVSLPCSVAEDLKLALDGRPEPATNRHLEDAIAVRDRLLWLVEGQLS
jgi:hypothetical protein